MGTFQKSSDLSVFKVGTKRSYVSFWLVATPATTSKPFTVARDGFSLNAAVSCQAPQRSKLERLCRYVARPPLALERLSVTDEGKLRYALKHPYSNGTTHFLFEPLDLLADFSL